MPTRIDSMGKETSSQHLQISAGTYAVVLGRQPESARKIAKEVAFLFEGRIVWNGEINDIDEAENPRFQQFINGYTEIPETL